MLIHLTPRYYARYNDVHVDIIDVEIPELKLILKANVDIIMRAPFPNKNYKVVCRKKGRKAINGILIEIDGELKNFTVISRWAVNGEISRHETYYHVTDNEFDAVTEEDFLWSGFFNTPYRTRCKEIEVGGTLVKRQSAMVTLIDDLNSNDGDNYWTYNKVDGEGFVRFRSEYIMLPTVERERIITSFFGNKRLPSYDDKFDAHIHPYKLTVVPAEMKELGVYVVLLRDWIRELKEDNEQELLYRILGEINSKFEFFLSNTNHLQSLAEAYSSTYNELSEHNKTYIDECLNQPIFHVLISDVEQEEKP
ncbi:hypothetical protein F0X33_18800 [Salmonella enterica]|uniref:Uncharacterized protein n=5 Tax=Salmonella enterica TaxID=28901 RepID=A0A5Y2DNJ8_SALMU|nr:DUF6012 family protein [Salmonella enterica]EAA1730950.1 hypothetical protein [Salmonella enterica subsp. enterica serovar Oranienburg]EAA1754444.1 hypothetical protein [Salmonella enterica subsp. enterica serovar Sundsvall]EAA2694833.1 hypothetical protein [Salmonella enterica subsp. enterica serovar Typhimurium]EAA5369826.1 hypothetical protein [Salmonella enterica subsp. arizonae]EAA5436651.1 hypothetical protein [Salmonella enterica subsp. enterica serovar Muenchen]EAA7339701.1 hypothe